jgi:hypothetical protein
MLWVFVFGGIAVAGLVMLVCYGVWLAHKSADVMSELHQLGERASDLAGLLAQVELPLPRAPGEAGEPRLVFDADVDPRAAT